MDSKNITLENLKQDVQEHLLCVTGAKDEAAQQTSFPMECLPPSIQKLVLDLHAGLGYPIDFTSISLLCAVATCIGNSLRIVKKKGWTQPATLFCVLVGRPGTCKSHPLNFAFRPLETVDMKYYDDYCREMEEYRKKEMIAKSKGKDGIEELSELAPPKRKQIIVSDVTIEALSKIIKNNPRGICLKMDELIGMIKNMARYSNSGSDQQKIMEIWSYQPLHVDRMSGSTPVSEPFCCIIGTMQPAVLQELASANRRSVGFMDRFIFVMPKNLEPNYWDENNGSTEHLEEEWSEFIDKLMERGNRRMANGDTTITMSPEANSLQNAWQRKNADMMKAVSEGVASAFSKLETYIIRLTLIFHELHCACNGTEKSTVTEESVKQAAKLIEYIRENTLMAHASLDLSSLTEKELDVYNDLPDHFKKGEGDKIAKASVDWDQRQLTRFLNKYRGTLFRKLDHGEYAKAYY